MYTYHSISSPLDDLTAPSYNSTCCSSHASAHVSVANDPPDLHESDLMAFILNIVTKIVSFVKPHVSGSSQARFTARPSSREYNHQPENGFPSDLI
jgi:hypothetical protein